MEEHYDRPSASWVWQYRRYSDAIAYGIAAPRRVSVNNYEVFYNPKRRQWVTVKDLGAGDCVQLHNTLVEMLRYLAASGDVPDAVVAELALLPRDPTTREPASAEALRWSAFL